MLPMREGVEKVIAEIRPMLQADGGDIELLEVSMEGIVRIRLKDACADCSDSMMPLREGIERMVKERVPAIKKVIAS